MSNKNVVLEEEFELTSVPLEKRKSVFSVSLIWIGFPMIITAAITGATVVIGLGFIKGMIAILLGNLLLFAYVGTLGALATKKRI